MFEHEGPEFFIFRPFLYIGKTVLKTERDRAFRPQTVMGIVSG